jgi:hypothetical protein
MVIDPAALATITTAVSVLGNEYFKGIAGEAGKATWTAVKSLFGWTSDPHPAEIPEKVTEALSVSPELAEKLLRVLKSDPSGAATAIVGKIEARGGKVVVAHTIVTNTLQM